MTSLDIIFFAALAGYIFLQLFKVLGREDFNNDKSAGDNNKAPEKSKDNVVGFPGAKPVITKTTRPAETSLDKRRKLQEPEINDVNIATQIDKIKEIDLSFSPGLFLEGAKMAFEMVIEAFSNERKDDLKNLLSADVYEVFGGEIDRLEKLGQHQDTTLISILASNISKVELSRKTARITVDFTSEQVYILRDIKTDEIVEGDLSDIDKIADSWIFERDLKSANPNWTIVAT